MKAAKIIKFFLPILVAGLALSCVAVNVDKEVFEPIPGKAKRDMEEAYLRQFGENLPWVRPLRAFYPPITQTAREIFKMSNEGFRCYFSHNGAFLLSYFDYIAPGEGRTTDLHGMLYDWDTTLIGDECAGARYMFSYVWRDGVFLSLEHDFPPENREETEFHTAFPVEKEEALIIKRRNEAYARKYLPGS